MNVVTVGKFAALAFAGLMVASCASTASTSASSSAAGSAVSTSSSPTSAVPSSSGTPEASAPALTADEAGKEFLAIICPTDQGIHVLGNVALAAGGWSKVKAKDAQPYAQSAADQARDSAERLLESVNWPPDVQETMSTVADEYLSLVTPLQQIAAATAGAQMSKPWGIVAARPQTAEQKARLQLGLPAAGAKRDGCPPAPKVVLPAKPSGSSGSSGGSTSSSGSGWTYRWQSPSGNLRCGYAPRSSIGVPVIACLDSQTNTLARLYANRPAMITNATSSQRSQLPGGPVRDFYETIWQGPFACALLDQGMTCQDQSTGAGFVIRRGVAYPTSR